MNAQRKNLKSAKPLSRQENTINKSKRDNLKKILIEKFKSKYGAKTNEDIITHGNGFGDRTYTANTDIKWRIYDVNKDKPISGLKTFKFPTIFLAQPYAIDKGKDIIKCH